MYPCNPQFLYIKVGVKGIKFTRACYPDVPFKTSNIQNHNRTTALERSVLNHCVAQPRSQFLKWFKTFS